MFKVNDKDTITTSMTLPLLLPLNFTPCSGVSIVDFEQVNVDCVTHW